MSTLFADVFAFKLSFRQFLERFYKKPSRIPAALAAG